MLESREPVQPPLQARVRERTRHISAGFERIRIDQILRTSHGSFVGDQGAATYHRNSKVVDLDVGPIRPRILETHTIDDRDHVYTVGRNADLVNRAFLLEVCRGQVVSRRAKCIQGP